MNQAITNFVHRYAKSFRTGLLIGLAASIFALLFITISTRDTSNANRQELTNLFNQNAQQQKAALAAIAATQKQNSNDIACVAYLIIHTQNADQTVKLKDLQNCQTVSSPNYSSPITSYKTNTSSESPAGGGKTSQTQSSSKPAPTQPAPSQPKPKSVLCTITLGLIGCKN